MNSRLRPLKLKKTNRSQSLKRTTWKLVCNWTVLTISPFQTGKPLHSGGRKTASACRRTGVRSLGERSQPKRWSMPSKPHHSGAATASHWNFPSGPAESMCQRMRFCPASIGRSLLWRGRAWGSGASDEWNGSESSRARTCAMWAVENHTPYAVERTWGRDKDGVHEWIVAVKATFNIKSDGNLLLADEQLEPLFLPEYNGEYGASSLRYDADLVGPKPTTDVVLNGTAYAPMERPATEFLVSLRLGAIYKVIKVMGNRTFERGVFGGGGPSAPEPVTIVPIVYERAFGGSEQSDPDPRRQQLDIRNPVGCGLVPQVGRALPNFEYP